MTYRPGEIRRRECRQSHPCISECRKTPAGAPRGHADARDRLRTAGRFSRKAWTQRTANTVAYGIQREVKWLRVPLAAVHILLPRQAQWLGNGNKPEVDPKFGSRHHVVLSLTRLWIRSQKATPTAGGGLCRYCPSAPRSSLRINVERFLEDLAAIRAGARSIITRGDQCIPCRPSSRLVACWQRKRERMLRDFLSHTIS